MSNLPDDAERFDHTLFSGGELLAHLFKSVVYTQDIQALFNGTVIHLFQEKYFSRERYTINKRDF